MNQLKFREAAIEQATSPEQLNELIRIIKPADWVVLSTILFFIIAFLLWSFFGKIPTRSIGQGIILAQNGEIYDAIGPENEARVISILVKPGSYVNKNDIVAYLSSPFLIKQVDIQKKFLDNLMKNFATQSETAKTQIEKREAETDKTKENLQKNLNDGEEHFKEVSDLLQRKQKMQKLGLVTLDQVSVTMSEYYQVQQQLKEINNQLIQNNISLESFKQEWQQRLHDMELRIYEAKRDLERSIEQLAISKNIVSPVSGIVTSIRAAIGDNVQNGKPVVSIATMGSGLDAVVYLTPEEGQRVKPGNRALVTPDVIQKEEYGSLEGTVVTVSEFPSSSDSILAVLHNEELVKKFTATMNMQTSISPVAMRIHIEKDPTTYSGYKWTSGSGPETKILPGMLVRAEVTVRQQAPISLFIPGLKRLIYEDSI